MKLCKNFSELEKELYARIDASMVTDINRLVKEKMSEHVQSDVYDKYTPKTYERRYDNDGLSDINNMMAEYSMSNHSLTVQNLTVGNSNYVPQDGFIAPIIESGEGYHYHFKYFDKPRPFIHNTYEDLLSSKEYIDTLKKSLQRQGLNVK